MIKQFFSSQGFWQEGGLAAVRIITGLLMIYHGWEVFDTSKMTDYAKWLTDLKFLTPVLMAYVGKGAELAGGILLTVGLLTRPAAIALAVTMAVICFGMGKGRIWMEDQHPFLFILLATVFFFTGGGKWSLDRVLFDRR